MTEVNAAATGMSSAITDHSGKYLNIPSAGESGGGRRWRFCDVNKLLQISVEVMSDG